MKTIKQVNKDIEDIEREIEEKTADKPASWDKKMTNKIVFLRTIIKYLEGEPRPEFISNELNRLNESIDKLNAWYMSWCRSLKDNITESQARGRFETEVGIKQMKNQIKSLKYILS